MTALGYTVHPVLNGTGGISEFNFAHLEEVTSIIVKLKKEEFFYYKNRNSKRPERRK
jgi:hypothetical protein